MDGAPAGVMLMRSFRHLPLVRRAAGQGVANPDPLDDEHAVFHLDVALALGDQLPAAGLDPARLQRAT